MKNKWFFIGLIVAVIGLTIIGIGAYQYNSDPQVIAYKPILKAAQDRSFPYYAWGSIIIICSYAILKFKVK